jgi:hypothetical protein
MMPNPPFDNRTMFWRIVRRLLAANRPRLFVLLLALGAGAAITSALLNLQVDAKRRLTTEFRAFGPNVIVASTRDANICSRHFERIDCGHNTRELGAQTVFVNSLLYVVGEAYKPGQVTIPW